MKQLRLDNWVDAKSNCDNHPSFFKSIYQHLLDSFPTNLSFATSPSSKLRKIDPFLYITQVTFRTEKKLPPSVGTDRCYWGNKRFELRSQGAGDDAWTTHCEGRVEQSGGGARSAEEVDAQCLWWTWWLGLDWLVGDHLVVKKMEVKFMNILLYPLSTCFFVGFSR